MSPTLFTPRLTIFPLSQSTPTAILDYYQRNQAHLAPTDPPHPDDFYTLNYWQDRIDQSLTESQKDTAARFVFALTANPAVIIGAANLTQIFRGPFQACYLGYSIDKDHEGQGFMYEALTAIIRFAFHDLNIHRIMANHLPENKRSAALLARLGFTVEGTAKDYLFINQRWRDHVLTALANPAWQSPN